MPSILERSLVFAGRTLFVAFRGYFEFIEAVLRLSIPNYRRPTAFDKFVSGETNISIDERIKKIDSARENLTEAIAAIDELRSQANSNKKDLQDALQRISEAEKQRQSLTEEIATVRQLAQADTQSFRRIIGLPTRADAWRERLIGFASGIIASIIASIIYAVVTNLISPTK